MYYTSRPCSLFSTVWHNWEDTSLQPTSRLNAIISLQPSVITDTSGSVRSSSSYKEETFRSLVSGDHTTSKLAAQCQVIYHKLSSAASLCIVLSSILKETTKNSSTIWCFWYQVKDVMNMPVSTINMVPWSST